MSTVEVRIPHWMYLSDEEQEWIQRELGFALAERGKTLVLHCTPSAKQRRENPDALGIFFCDSCVGDFYGKISIPDEMFRCDSCGRPAQWKRVWSD